MRGLFFVLAALVFATAIPVFAQGPFTDVPTDHWAYDAVNLLQKDGYVIGYPDGTFGGKRAITRYEFAVAIARIIAAIPPPTTLPPTVTPPPAVDLSDYVKRSDLPDFSKFATKDDLLALRRLIDEFRDELAALGVDVDALKRDVAALDCRVTALEAEQRRVKISGNANIFGIAANHRGGSVVAFDRDERPIGFANTLGRNISVVKDFDLNVVGRINTGTTANATVNYGDYLNYLAFLDDYAGGVYSQLPPVNPDNPRGQRPTSTGGRTNLSGGNSTVKNSLSDAFFPYYLYIDAGLGKGELAVGRFPLQFTPYTLRKIDVDSYTSILKTDDGSYPVDGVKVAYNFGGVDLTLYAAKHNENDYLLWGLSSQPTAGIYDQNALVGAKPMHVLGGHAAGGLPFEIAQSAGVRAILGIPWSGKLGFTFYQGWSQAAFGSRYDWDQVRVFGADLNVPFWNSLLFSGTWNQCNTLGRNNAGVRDITNDNKAWDGKFGFALGKLGLAAGYKSIGQNYAAAGSWDKIGRWTNPANIKGPYANAAYPVTPNLNLVLTGEWLKVIDPTANTGNARLTKNDELIHAEGGVRWGISRLNALALGYEWNQFSPTGAGTKATESYLTIGWAHQFGAAGMQIGYQFINYDGSSIPTFAYGSNTYRAGLGVVQFGVSF